MRETGPHSAGGLAGSAIHSYNISVCHCCSDFSIEAGNPNFMWNTQHFSVGNAVSQTIPSTEPPVCHVWLERTVGWQAVCHVGEF